MGIDNLEYAHISPFFTGSRELPGIGFTAAAFEGYLYILGEADGNTALFRAAEEEWVWETFLIPDSVYDISLHLRDGSDFNGPPFRYAFRNAAGNIVFIGEQGSYEFQFTGTAVQAGSGYGTFAFTAVGVDYSLSLGQTEGVFITDIDSATQIAQLTAPDGYSYGSEPNLVALDGESLYLTAWPEGSDVYGYGATYLDLKMLKLPLTGVTTWSSLSYPYGGEEITFTADIEMNTWDVLSIGPDRIWIRSSDTSHFFSPSGELLIDATMASIPRLAAYSQATGRLYSVEDNRVYEYTIP